MPYWALLGHTRPSFLGITRPYWALLGLIGPYCALLGLTGPYWALLGTKRQIGFFFSLRAPL